MLTWKAIGKNVLVRVIVSSHTAGSSRSVGVSSRTAGSSRSVGEAECGLVVQDNGTIVVEGMTGKLVRWAEGTKVRFLEENATWIDFHDRLAVVNRDDILCVGEESVEDCAECGQPIEGEPIRFMGTSSRCRPCHDKRMKDEEEVEGEENLEVTIDDEGNVVDEEDPS